MKLPEGAPIRRFRCHTCGTQIEIAVQEWDMPPECPRCELPMDVFASEIGVLAPAGHRWRSDECDGCGAWLNMVPLALWTGVCATCPPRTTPGSALTPTERTSTERLLASVLDSSS